jgi:hypothetical protein
MSTACHYPTDVSDAQWEALQLVLPPPCGCCSWFGGGGNPKGPAPASGAAFCFSSPSGIGRLGVPSIIVCQESPIRRGNLHPHTSTKQLISQAFLVFEGRGSKTAAGDC